LLSRERAKRAFHIIRFFSFLLQQAGTLLALAAATSRFIDGLVTPLLYRRAVAPFPPEQRQAVTQFQGSVAIGVTCLGTWLCVALVRSGALRHY